MKRVSEFNPDWASPPGATISDLMAAYSWTQSEFADRLGEPESVVEQLLSGNARLTDKIADKLASVFNSSPGFWLSRENRYRSSLAKISESIEWLSALPERHLQRSGEIKTFDTISERVSSMLSFFGASSIQEWSVEHSGRNRIAAFRTSPTLESNEGATLVWLRQGEIAANEIQCGPWDLKGFVASLQDIRLLTCERDPEIFIPKLKEICASNGVVLSIIRTPPGCRASGVARFLPNGKPQLMLSFRYLSDDHFWFTFFHEAGHLILHSHSRIFLDGIENEGRDQQEIEANEFAANVLIPREFCSELEKLPLEFRPVIRFARKLGIAPGIVVGQLQFKKICPQNRLNKLKVKYSWE